MITREELLQSPEYWFEEAQNELYRQVTEYMSREGLNQSQLAQKLAVSKGYISQILNGNFNYTLKKLIELSLAIGKIPRIRYQTIASVLEKDGNHEFVFFTTVGPIKSLPMVLSTGPGHSKPSTLQVSKTNYQSIPEAA